LDLLSSPANANNVASRSPESTCATDDTDTEHNRTHAWIAKECWSL
jgi:hypothetical protein